MRKLPIVLGLALTLVVAGGASASFFDNFDSYLNGQILDGTADDGGWKGWDNTPAAGATVTNLVSLSPENSVDVSGPSDLVHEFNEAGALTFSVWQLIPTDTTGTTYFILLNTYNDGGPYNWSTEVSFNLGTGLLSDDFVAGATLPIQFGQWTEIRVDIDTVNDTQNVYYGGNLLSTNTWTRGDANAQLALEAVDLFANGAGSVYYDNVSLIPEPSSLFALAGFLPALALLRRRR